MSIDPAIRAIVTDIEGTTTPIAFVRDVLFPYARAYLSAFLASESDRIEVAAVLREIRRQVPDREPEATLLMWMDQDAKITPLKILQGLIWEHGYRSGAIKSPVYTDVAPALQAWRQAGKRLFVYSSGSIAAQNLLFGHSDAGDLRPLFTDYFDTTIGGKREEPSYHAIAGRIGVPPSSILFLSDIEAELDAAKAAGWRTTQLLRAADGTVPSSRHPAVADFTAIAA